MDNFRHKMKKKNKTTYSITKIYLSTQIFVIKFPLINIDEKIMTLE